MRENSKKIYIKLKILFLKVLTLLDELIEALDNIDTTTCDASQCACMVHDLHIT